MVDHPPRRVVLWLGRHGELAFQDLDGRPLFVHALVALTSAAPAMTVVVDSQDLPRVRDVARRIRPATQVRAVADWWGDIDDATDRDLLVHDVRCPLVTADFLTQVGQVADSRPGVAVVAVRPVTDTLKSVVDGRIDVTVDRDLLVALSSPLVVPAAVVQQAASQPEPPPFDDFSQLVTWLRGRVEVEFVRAPSLGRRVEHARAVHVLECLYEVGHRVRASRA